MWSNGENWEARNPNNVKWVRVDWNHCVAFVRCICFIFLSLFWTGEHSGHIAVLFFLSRHALVHRPRGICCLIPFFRWIDVVVDYLSISLSLYFNDAQRTGASRWSLRSYFSRIFEPKDRDQGSRIKWIRQATSLQTWHLPILSIGIKYKNGVSKVFYLCQHLFRPHTYTRLSTLKALKPKKKGAWTCSKRKASEY